MSLFASNYKTYINHTDAGGIVYHGNYLTFYENCRRDWFTQLGFDGYFLYDEDTQGNQLTIHPVVSNANVRFIKPILIDTLITVSIDEVIAKPASLTFIQSIHDEQGICFSKAEIVIACVKNEKNKTGNKNGEQHDQQQLRPTRVPKGLLESINNWQ